MKSSILLVDDIEANLIALEAALGDLDCELVRTSSGNDALRQLLKREFAVILLDVQMPGMDGYEVASLARQNPRTRDVPIVFLTANHHTEENVLRGYGSGAIDFLLKPVNAQVLRAKVSAFLDLHNSRKRLADEVQAHKKTLRSLELANEALRHFTSAASHDLRAPLRTICSFLQLVIEDSGPSLDAQSKDYIERSIRAGSRMSSLLDSLLSYAQLRKPSQWAHVDCDAVAEQVRSDLSESLDKTGGTLELANLPTIHGDADRIYQLLLNLVSNALKFRRPDTPPAVRVSAERAGDEWEICVADNGIGVESEHCKAIFDAFRRLHNQSEYEGSGLGLAICQQIVEQHGGRIWLTSRKGAGSKVHFVLPARQSATSEQAPAPGRVT
jgi:two-component system sensor histidine kinase/response regulator